MCAREEREDILQKLHCNYLSATTAVARSGCSSPGLTSETVGMRRRGLLGFVMFNCIEENYTPVMGGKEIDALLMRARRRESTSRELPK